MGADRSRISFKFVQVVRDFASHAFDKTFLSRQWSAYRRQPDTGYHQETTLVMFKSSDSRATANIQISIRFPIRTNILFSASSGGSMELGMLGHKLVHRQLGMGVVEVVVVVVGVGQVVLEVLVVHLVRGVRVVLGLLVVRVVQLELLVVLGVREVQDQLALV